MHSRYIRRLLQRVRKELSYSRSGTQISRIKGEGFDFAELIPYQEGMDARKIYWNSLAKGEQLQYKTFFEEKEVYVAAALLMDGSLAFGEPVRKLEKALECVAYLGYAALDGRHFFQGVGISEKETAATAPLRQRHAMERWMVRLGGMDPLFTELDYRRAVDRIWEHIRPKSLLFVVGDFLQIPDLRKLAAKHALVAIVIRDRFETHPRPLGEVIVRDPQTGEQQELFFDQKRADAYGAKFRAHDQKLQHYFRRHGIGYHYLCTHERVGVKLR